MTGPFALITRPRDDALDLAAALEERGFTPLLAPMLEIHPHAAPIPSRERIQALLLTSGNGARALANCLGNALPAWQSVPVYAVGDSTARLAAAHGFTQVESAEGDVAALESLVAARANPSAGALLHVSGTSVAGDLAGALQKRGFRVEQAALYRADPVVGLSADVVKALTEARIALALFFSPRTSHHFALLVQKAGLGPHCAAVQALCLSAAVAETLAELPWKAVLVAPHPVQSAMLSVLDGV